MSEKIVGSIATTESLKGDLYAVFARDGKSAYEIAVKNGFDGTEAEWVASLKGEKGNTPSITFRYDEETGNLYYSVKDAEVLDEVKF